MGADCRHQPPCATQGAGRQLAIVGAGWAGLAAAVRAVQAGWQVSLLDMAPQAGGRARSQPEPLPAQQAPPLRLDNGQHILIGAYRRTLALMDTLGVDTRRALLRCPLALLRPDGSGLRLRRGPLVPALLWGLLQARGLGWRDALALLRSALRWQRQGWRCAPGLTVRQLCADLPPALWQRLIAPLCLAALNTPADNASAQVWLRVLRDALLSGPGSADLLLPRRPLAELLPDPALHWLRQHGAHWHPRSRVLALQREPGGTWQLHTAATAHRADAVLLACSAAEAARLAQGHAPAWSQRALGLRHSAILTVWLREPGLRLPLPMLALDDTPAPGPCPPAAAQFVFDLGALGLARGLYAFVVSGADEGLRQGLAAAARQVLAQARLAFPGHFQPPSASTDDAVIVHAVCERRATFACTPDAVRPEAQLADGLWAAGDYIDGPYPATLEGAVLAAETAVHGLTERFAMQK